ncbi:hypothetical protein KW496_19495 [Vibrio fluvialis]|nr:hypothetical protein [Vibrio fluvialis]
MKDNSLIEIVDSYVLTQYSNYKESKYNVVENPFDDDTTYNDYSGNVQIICNINQIEDIRRFEAKMIINNYVCVDIFSESFNDYDCLDIIKEDLDYLTAIGSIKEYLRYNFNERILLSEIKKSIISYEQSDEFFAILLYIFSFLNSIIYSKYKTFYDRDPYDEDNDDAEDDNCNGFILDFDVGLDTVNLNEFNYDIKKTFDCSESDLRTFEKLKAVVGESAKYRMFSCKSGLVE